MCKHRVIQSALAMLLAFVFANHSALAMCPASSAKSTPDEDNAAAAEEVRQCLLKFNNAWKERDLDFVRQFYAHDPDMLLFFERRQLRGWETVETLYENMFAHALPGSVKSNYANINVQASGDMAYVAANFHLQTRNPEGEEMTDSGRVSVVFERRDEQWVVIHRHTSFQAPPGPQRRVPIYEGPGPLWNPTLEGMWQGPSGAAILATANHLSARDVPGLPELSRYRVDDDGIWLLPTAGSLQNATLVETVHLTGTELVLRMPDGPLTFHRLE